MIFLKSELLISKKQWLSLLKLQGNNDVNKDILKQNIKKFLIALYPSFFYFLRRRNNERNIFPRAFTEHMRNLSKTDVVIDIGANVGMVSESLATTGARVIAFEPNTAAFAKLKLVTERFDNIEAHNVAVGSKNQQVKLYLHKDRLTKKADLTQASSLLKNKPNVSNEFFEEIREIDFAEFLKSLNRHIELIKIDIEGYEIELLNHMLDYRLFDRIKKVYVETHELKFPELVAPTKALKERIKTEGYNDKFCWGWH